MGIIKDIIHTYGPEYLARYQHTMPTIHKKVIQDIMQCKTEGCGITLFQCEKCHSTHLFNLSCGNRHCPNCQHQKTRVWLDKQMQSQLPEPHFMVTFTMPGKM